MLHPVQQLIIAFVQHIEYVHDYNDCTAVSV